MERVKLAVLPFGPLISIVVALVSLSATTLLTHRWNNSAPPAPPRTVHVFEHTTVTAIHGVQPLILDGDASTNRTLWTTVSTEQLHAGLERVEPGAGIPAHAHDSEEIVVVYGGRGVVVDHIGRKDELGIGSMMHFQRKAIHSIRNIGDEPLLLMWIFPVTGDKRKFSFGQTYTAK